MFKRVKLVQVGGCLSRMNWFLRKVQHFPVFDFFWFWDLFLLLTSYFVLAFYGLLKRINVPRILQSCIINIIYKYNTETFLRQQDLTKEARRKCPLLIFLSDQYLFQKGFNCRECLIETLRYISITLPKCEIFW